MPTVHQQKVTTWSSVHLDAVRGLAALAVMGFHEKSFFFSSLSQADDPPVQSGQLQAATAPPVFYRRADMGNTPVMIFFVLSGFLVGGSVIKSLKARTWSSKTYLIKRLTRLWVVLIPALILGVALDYAGYYFLSKPKGIYVDHIGYLYPHLQQNFQWTTILGNVAFLQGIFVTTPGSNGALWSLGNEFWYYILFPLIVVPLAMKNAWLTRIGALCCAVAFIAFLLYHTDLASLKNIPVLFPIWLMGALLATAPLKITTRLRVPATMLMLIVVVCGTALLRKFDLGVHLSQYLIGFLFTALLYTLLHYREVAGKGIYRSVSEFFSKISYSLYVIHMPAGAFLAALMLQPWHVRQKNLSNLLLFGLFCCVVTAASFLFYLAFEANTDRIRRRFFENRKEVRLGSSSNPSASLKI